MSDFQDAIDHLHGEALSGDGEALTVHLSRSGVLYAVAFGAALADRIHDGEGLAALLIPAALDSVRREAGLIAQEWAEGSKVEAFARLLKQGSQSRVAAAAALVYQRLLSHGRGAAQRFTDLACRQAQLDYVT
jgi:hypothetical protein